MGEQADIVVLGAGMAELCAAMAATDAGADVLVLEAAEPSGIYGAER
jgi:succinate dehydrogenase/fumarate reductase flavoprotein subunit